MKRGFTITELLVAMGLLVAILAASGVVFSSAVDAKRTADATSEIALKLSVITDQLTADFTGLQKDGDIFLAWSARPVLGENGVAVDEDNDGVPDRYERFDSIVFFATGDFYSYHTINGEIIRGNTARICYMLAKKDYSTTAYQQKTNERILARSQHILTMDSGLPDPCLPDFGNIPVPLEGSDNIDYIDKNNTLEYDWTFLDGWKDALRDHKRELFTVTTGVRIGTGDRTNGGLMVDVEFPKTIHLLFSEGVGQFAIQGWYEAEQRWFPAIDPCDTDGDLSDSDFFTTGTPTVIDLGKRPAILYPNWNFESGSLGVYDPTLLNEANFNQIPGFGRAFKFTFTLYDSIGVFPEGKTFTHIVYLDK